MILLRNIPEERKWVFNKQQVLQECVNNIWFYLVVYLVLISTLVIVWNFQRFKRQQDCQRDCQQLLLWEICKQRLFPPTGSGGQTSSTLASHNSETKYYLHRFSLLWDILRNMRNIIKEVL